MTLGYTDQLLILACDHRGSFQKKLLGIEGTPTPDEEARIRNAKFLIFSGFRQALSEGGVQGMGILIDEQFGAEPAREARELGVVLAMPVEKSGQDEFDFEYGEGFGLRPHLLEGARPLQPRGRRRDEPPPGRAPRAAEPVAP
jgi:myo-inositol catabolism protein IolC